ncbi:MAG TPA: type II toxin-antitoxin system mRNA interferase toxin, RelE/StbE family [Parafilimonas sp.]|nr:type II toxin-antitoxin system mRNA interferase toxin, RelE/StbE family [Parafilimonas sp.]
MKKIEFSNPFKKSFKKTVSKNADVAFAVMQKLFIMSQEINHPSLKLHKLKGALSNYYAISIEYDLRIILEISDDKIILVDIGTHDEVY